MEAPGLMSEAPAPKVAAPEYAPKIEGAVPLSKKKKKSKSKGGKSVAKRGPTALPANRGSGFEEYFADPPITPREAEEERENVYSEDLPFEERIQSCIQRFRCRRRLQEENTRYFDEYLFLGGIDTNPNPFSGQDPGELKKLTPAERRAATAHDGIILSAEESRNERMYTGDLANWSIDFTGVAAGFFSMSMGPLTGFEAQALEKAVNVIDNFLRYTLQHDVCPEYEDDIKQALVVCQDAKEEWPMILRAQAAMPGQFNLAASKLFKSYLRDDWHIDDSSKHVLGMDAKAVFLSSLALMNEPKLFSKYGPETKVIREFDCTVEITTIIRPDEDIVKRFKSLKVGDRPLGLNPTGKMKVKPATIEEEWEPVNIDQTFKTGVMTLYLDDKILADLKPGMKMALRVCQLDIDLKFVKSLHQIVPTFHTFLPQDLMRYFKPPRENDRPAPSIHDRPEGQDESQQAEHAAAGDEIANDN